MIIFVTPLKMIRAHAVSPDRTLGRPSLQKKKKIHPAQEYNTT